MFINIIKEKKKDIFAPKYRETEYTDVHNITSNSG